MREFVCYTDTENVQSNLFNTFTAETCNLTLKIIHNLNYINIF